MFARDIVDSLQKAASQFPAIVVTGARQTGKTTLCKSVFGQTKHKYISLEDPDERAFALTDPRAFLQKYSAPVIFDEIQYAPELINYIQTLIDINRTCYGQYILTGSQNFLLMESVTQSLAGRAYLLHLYPLSSHEMIHSILKHKPDNLTEYSLDWILRGGYPELRARPDLDRKMWCSSYIRLYLERDVRQIINVENLTLFERFLRLVAARTGQLLNISDLARDADISHVTAHRWLSILKTSYQIYLLEPYHANISKRLVKAPKLYFCDTALATFLMGIHDQDILQRSASFGALFETAIVMECVKHFQNHGDIPSLNFFRTHGGLEADLLIENSNHLSLYEIKSSQTLSTHWGTNLQDITKELKRKSKTHVLSLVETETMLTNKTQVLPWIEAKWE